MRDLPVFLHQFEVVLCLLPVDYLLLQLPRQLPGSLSHELVADRVQKEQLTTLLLVKHSEVCSFFLIEDRVDLPIGDVVPAMLSMVVRVVLLVNEALGFFDAFPRKGVNLLHPAFYLLIITMPDITLDLFSLLLKDLQNPFRCDPDHPRKVQILSQGVRIVDSVIVLPPCLQGKADFAVVELLQSLWVDSEAVDDVIDFIGFIADRAAAGFEGFMRRIVHL